jgi:hypothetical protein
MRGNKTWTSTFLVGLMALALPAGLAWANHVRMEGGNDSPPGVIYAPPGSAVVVHRTAGRNRTNSTISVGFIASRPP